MHRKVIFWRPGVSWHPSCSIPSGVTDWTERTTWGNPKMMAMENIWKIWNFEVDRFPPELENGWTKFEASFSNKKTQIGGSRRSRHVGPAAEAPGSALFSSNLAGNPHLGVPGLVGNLDRKPMAFPHETTTRPGQLTVCELENGHWNGGFTHQKWWFSIVNVSLPEGSRFRFQFSLEPIQRTMAI